VDKEKIKVLVVDDSALMRSLIGKIIDSQDDMVVVGKAMNGAFALQKIPILKPDIIILDIEMPEMNGIEFLKEKNKKQLKIPVVVLSSIARKGAKVTFEALSSGASDFITKPTGEVSSNISNVASQLCSLIRAYTGHKNIDARQTEENETTQAKPVEIRQKDETLKYPDTSRGVIEIIAIGISTGGPNALRFFLSKIKKDFRVPIVIVQHMPEGFTAEFAKSLGRACPLDVKEAEEGDLILPGRVFIAPGNRHIKIEKKPLGTMISLNEEKAVNGHRPSAGVLFNTVAQNYGNRAMGVIMTGMGKDGAAEIGEIYKAGGYTIAQDEESSIVFGMPRVAIENGFIRKVLPLDEMADFITNLIN
jgi:two-component system chemotaxis response regulator CheB